jgi:hypothetical protein
MTFVFYKYYPFINKNKGVFMFGNSYKEKIIKLEKERNEIL